MTYCRLPSVFVLGQVDPGDGAEGSEELLQVRLSGVLGQIGHADGGVVIRWGWEDTPIEPRKHKVCVTYQNNVFIWRTLSDHTRRNLNL